MDELIAEINAAATGAEMRVPLVRAFTYLFENGKEASRLATRPPREEGFKDYKYFAMRANTIEKNPDTGQEYVRIGISTLLPFDNWTSIPDKSSAKLVTGATVYAVCGNIKILMQQIYDLLG